MRFPYLRVFVGKIKYYIGECSHTSMKTSIPNLECRSDVTCAIGIFAFGLVRVLYNRGDFVFEAFLFLLCSTYTILLLNKRFPEYTDIFSESKYPILACLPLTIDIGFLWTVCILKLLNELGRLVLILVPALIMVYLLIPSPDPSPASPPSTPPSTPSATESYSLSTTSRSDPTSS